jgi:hypothetical protein
MATYGSRDQNLFIPPKKYKINGVETDSNLGDGKYYTIVEADGPNKGQITIKSPNASGSLQGSSADRTVGVITPGKPIEITPGSTTRDEEKYFKSVAGQTTVKGNAKITAQRGGLDDNSSQQLISPGSPTIPNKPAEGQLSKDQINTIKDAAGKDYKGRKIYPGGDLRYPEKMDTNQDCIQFKIIKYVSRGLGLDKNLGLRKDAPPAGNILATITLPMPSGGISDRNSVNWQSGELNPATEAVATALNSFLLGGAEAGANKAKDQFGAVFGDKSDTKLLKALIASKTIQEALGTNVLSRQYGVVINPNLELLFDSPSLRDFSFSFKMTPRSKEEAIRVRTIIRYFKQAMSVKRSQSVLLLKAPHTFRIQYKTSNQDHPYLNRFKECALTNCSVNYTPDGQYMSYDDSSPNGRSMTAYELSLSFQELEPIFDDDYDDKDALPTNIGY